jgi:hypothetical protein
MASLKRLFSDFPSTVQYSSSGIIGTRFDIIEKSLKLSTTSLSLAPYPRPRLGKREKMLGYFPCTAAVIAGMCGA